MRAEKYYLRQDLLFFLGKFFLEKLEKAAVVEIPFIEEKDIEDFKNADGIDNQQKNKPNELFFVGGFPESETFPKKSPN